MKKYFLTTVCIILSLIVFAGCTKEVDNSEELNKYKTEMTAFFTSLEKIDTAINAIDPSSQDSMDELLKQFDVLVEQFKKLSEIEVPAEFISNKDLAVQAYEYMVQANEYLKQSFSETSYNEKVLEAAMECYRRANKRVQYIISLLHGELPQGEGVSYE